jgi:PadR family transcriptional regulator, regulatory protein PadR
MQEDRGQDVLDLQLGSVRALDEEAGWLTSSWGQAETNRRAKFYSLTKRGRKQLQTETGRWARISLAMGAALEIGQEAP